MSRYRRERNLAVEHFDRLQLVSGREVGIAQHHRIYSEAENRGGRRALTRAPPLPVCGEYQPYSPYNVR
jgi:hypothetical protein